MKECTKVIETKCLRVIDENKSKTIKEKNTNISIIENLNVFQGL